MYKCINVLYFYFYIVAISNYVLSYFIIFVVILFHWAYVPGAHPGVLASADDQGSRHHLPAPIHHLIRTRTEKQNKKEKDKY